MCPDPGVPAGTTRIGDIFGFDDKVKYSCNGNLYLVGSSERLCRESGQWTGTEPTCYCKTDIYVCWWYSVLLEKSLAMKTLNGSLEKYCWTIASLCHVKMLVQRFPKMDSRWHRFWHAVTESQQQQWQIRIFTSSPWSSHHTSSAIKGPRKPFVSPKWLNKRAHF